jgi:hypothetical protein
MQTSSLNLSLSFSLLFPLGLPLPSHNSAVFFAPIALQRDSSRSSKMSATPTAESMSDLITTRTLVNNTASGAGINRTEQIGIHSASQHREAAESVFSNLGSPKMIKEGAMKSSALEREEQSIGPSGKRNWRSQDPPRKKAK